MPERDANSEKQATCDDGRARRVANVAGTAVTLLIATGCLAGPLAPENPFENKTYSISCEDGRRYAVKALRTAGYKITSVERSGDDAVVHGENEANKISASLSIRCSSQGVNMKPSTGTRWASDSLHFGFDRLVETGNRIWPPPKGPVLKMDLYQGQEAKIEFPTELEPHGVVAVRVFFLNGGDRPLRIDPRRIRGVTKSDRRVRPLSEEDVEGKLGGVDSNIKSKLLKPATLKQGGKVIGFIFLPVDSYAGASIDVIDEMTGEGDVYDAAFSSRGS